MTLTELNEHFGLAGLLKFEDHDGLTRLQVTTQTAVATLYLQGAHLTHWQPAGQHPVLFLSRQTSFAEGKAIRGGIPICFPWFGPRSDGQAGPSHGFARTQSWEVAFAALAGQDVHLTLTLAPTEVSRAMGYGEFRLAYELVIGSKLTLRLTVANTGSAPLKFEEALHTYFAADLAEVRIEGLESALYLDKTDSMREKEEPGEPFAITAETDRVYPENVSSVTIADGSRRKINIDKSNSATTVVWNPNVAASAKLTDLAQDEWPHFVCVETANTGVDAITLPPGETHTLQAEYTVVSA